MWLKIWQDERWLDDWVEDREDTLGGDDSLSQDHHWHVINTWPFSDKHVGVLYPVVKFSPADCPLDEINAIIKHNFVLIRS